GNVASSGDGKDFVDSPSRRDVVENYPLAVVSDVHAVGGGGIELCRSGVSLTRGYAIGTSVEVAGAESQVTQNYVLGVRDFDRVSPERDAARRRLPSDGQVAFANFQLRVQRNRPGDVEHDRPRSFGRAHGMAEGTVDLRLGLRVVV